MTSTRWMSRLAFITAMLMTASLSAQGLRGKGQEQQQLWLKFEKELGLQARYSVDMEVQAMGMTMPSKIYRLDKQTRTEMTLPFMNLRMVILQLEENGKSVSYSLFPDKKKYCVNDPAGEAAEKTPAYKVTDLGTETYEGATCKKRRLTVTLQDGGTQDMDMLFSPAQKNMPVKMTATIKTQAEPGQAPATVTSTTLFKNYRFAAPAASLFALPKDYTKAASMQEVMMSSMGGFALPAQSGQATAAGQPDLGALIRQAQADAAKESLQESQGTTAPAQNMQQNLQGLRSLLGK